MGRPALHQPHRADPPLPVAQGGRRSPHPPRSARRDQQGSSAGPGGRPPLPARGGSRPAPRRGGHLRPRVRGQLPARPARLGLRRVSHRGRPPCRALYARLLRECRAARPWSHGAVQRRIAAFGGHTDTHPWMAGLPGPERWDELTRPRPWLDRYAPADFRPFAYPNGFSDPELEGMTARAGFACALTCEVDAPGELASAHRVGGSSPTSTPFASATSPLASRGSPAFDRAAQPASSGRAQGTRPAPVRCTGRGSQPRAQPPDRDRRAAPAPGPPSAPGTRVPSCHPVPRLTPRARAPAPPVTPPPALPPNLLRRPRHTPCPRQGWLARWWRGRPHGPPATRRNTR